MMSSSEASVCSSRGDDPKAQYKTPEGYSSNDGSGVPSSYNYDTKEIVDSSSEEESGIHFDLN